MRECLIYTSDRSKQFIEKDRRLAGRDTLLPVHYQYANSEDKSYVPVPEKQALHAIRVEMIKYSSSKRDYDFLQAALNPIVPGLKVYWEPSRLENYKRKIRELKDSELALLRFASVVYKDFIDENELPILCRNYTVDFPKTQELYLCNYRYVYDASYDEISIYTVFDDITLNVNLKQLLLKFPKAILHLITLTPLDINSYISILSNYLGYKLECNFFVEAVGE